jgi:NAD(P)H dehydrogenase (quinone)
MKGAFQDTDVLLLIPTLAPVEHRVQQFFQALEAAKAAGVKRVVFSSFATAVPESKFYVSPFYMYAESKLRLSGLEWTILRNGMYLDPIADWIPELVEMGRLPYPVKEGKTAYISREDLARATAAACLDSGHSEKVYELTGAEALSMPRLAEIISKVTGKPVRFDCITDDEFAQVCREGNEDVPEPMIAILTSLYHAVDNKEFERVTDHVELLTGTPPETAESYLARKI